jgi:hypothetical protein
MIYVITVHRRQLHRCAAIYIVGNATMTGVPCAWGSLRRETTESPATPGRCGTSLRLM